MTASTADGVYLRAEGLSRTFGSGPDAVRAVDDVSFEVQAGRTLVLVGESGSGKTTAARIVLGLERPDAGSVRIEGRQIVGLGDREMREVRRRMQVVLQDPSSQLNRRHSVEQIVSAPMKAHRIGDRSSRRERVLQVLESVGLHERHLTRRPSELSGGQCQRIGIARALVVEPKLLICDEPVSALDVSIQAQVINLLMQLQRDLGLAMIFIAHDLSVVKHISDRVMVLYLGRAMEVAESRALYARPEHPYTQALLSSVPIPDPVAERAKKAIPLEGDLPSPLAPPSGCVFRTRCPRAQSRCTTDVPVLTPGLHQVACHYPGPANSAPKRAAEHAQ